jgi:hypothetical protein
MPNRWIERLKLGALLVIDLYHCHRVYQRR